MAKDFLIATAKNVTDQTKAQKTFYTYLKKIDKLKEEVVEAQAVQVHFAQQKGEQLIPSEKMVAAVRAEWIKLLFRWRDNSSISYDLVQTITQTIVEEAYDLINIHNFNDLIPIYDECAAVDYETERIAEEEDQKESMRQQLEYMGVEIEGDLSEENIMEHIAKAQEKMKEQAEAEAERKAKRKKTAKQQKKAEELAVQKAIETKSMREIYMKLAKEFHPDTEPDEDERLRKTEIMQRITAAYEANDLPELLRLQLEYEQISLDKIDQLTDAKLLAYNNVLKEQIKQLEQEKEMEFMKLSMHNPQLPQYIRFRSVAMVDDYVKKEVKEMEKTKRQLEKDIAELLDTPAVVKKYLKRLKKAQQNSAKFDINDILSMMFG